MTRQRQSLSGLLVCICLCWAVSAHANAVTDWNAITVTYVATGAPGTPPIPVGRTGPPGLFDIAIVQAAVHDAVQAIEGRYEPYFYSDPSKFGVGNPAAAVAAAAHRVLVLLYPGQAGSLNTRYNDYLNAHGLNGDPGLAVGEAAAAALFTQYRPTLAVAPFTGFTETGQWRSLNNTSMSFLFMAFSEPFTLNRASQFRPQPPPPLNSGQYLREYNEAMALGNINRPADGLTDMANFWSGNFVSMWNEALQPIANAQALDIGDSARLFALANLAAADAAIAVWDSKYFYNYWRPITAIREGDTDGIAKTAGDVTWTPLIAAGTPNYPDYVSGANGLTGAFTGMLQRFLGSDALTFSVKTTAAAAIDKERDFTHISQAAHEVVEARILLGIHFRAADEEARQLGDRIAGWVFQKFLRPLPGGQR